LFSPWEQRVVARCQGHSSFVSAVAFDELRCDGRTYRFGSVGEDNKLILVSHCCLASYSPILTFRVKVGLFQWSSSSSKTSGKLVFLFTILVFSLLAFHSPHTTTEHQCHRPSR